MHALVLVALEAAVARRLAVLVVEVVDRPRGNEVQLARGTIEEKIAELQQRKAALVRELLGDGGTARALTREDLAYLLAPVEAD